MKFFTAEHCGSLPHTHTHSALLHTHTHHFIATVHIAIGLRTRDCTTVYARLNTIVIKRIWSRCRKFCTFLSFHFRLMLSLHFRLCSLRAISWVFKNQFHTQNTLTLESFEMCVFRAYRPTKGTTQRVTLHSQRNAGEYFLKMFKTAFIPIFFFCDYNHCRGLSCQDKKVPTGRQKFR